MLSNKLSYEFLNQDLLSNDNNKINEWLADAKVSKVSIFKDELWILDSCESLGKTFSHINWLKDTESGYKLSDFPSILETMKRIVFYLSTTLVTRKKAKTLTQHRTYVYFLIVVDWMLNNKINSFNNLTKKDIENYSNWLKTSRKFNGKPIKDLRNYLLPIQYLYRYNVYLNDKVIENFIDEGNVEKFVGYKKNIQQQTKAIPTNIIEDICKKIIPIIDYFNENEFSFNTIHTQKIIKKQSNNIKLNEYYINILNASCYFLIALYTGMRVSEVLSIKKDAYYINEKNIAVIKSQLFKLVPENQGRPEEWGAGINNDKNYAVKCIDILKKLNITNNVNDYIFNHINRKDIVRSESNYIQRILKELMVFCNVDWDLSSHQLRRTFACLIGTSDKTNLLALKEHFKHASLAMTDYYVGKNIELLGMINEEKQLEIINGLEIILSSGNLAGKMGEKITKSNSSFRGSIEVRKEYIDSVINNSDMIIMPHEYGFCIYQEEQAKCRGEVKNIGLNTCTKCANFVVSPKHKTFWLNRVEEYEQFKKSINNLPNQQLTVNELQFAINEAQGIITKINEEKK